MNTVKEKYIIDIVSKLKYKTNSNEVQWEETSRKNQYILKMNNASFLIGKNERITNGGNMVVLFKVLNDVGDEVQSIEQSYSTIFGNVNSFPFPIQNSLEQLLKDLYESVENNVKDPNNESLQKIINELDSFSNSK